MERNRLSLGLAIIFLAFCSSNALAQVPRIPRIGFLSTQSSSRSAERADAFRRGLRELGYIEGKNILIEYRWGDGITDRLASLADELVHLKVDMIVTSGGNLANIAAKNATPSVPIIFSGGGDAVAIGLVESFSRPGGNITGVTNGGPELTGKRLEVLRDTIPKLRRAGYVFNPKASEATPNSRELSSAAQGLGLKVYSFEVSRADEIDRAFTSAVRERVEALLISQNPPISSDYRRVVDLTVKHRLPAIFSDVSWIATGGLMSYGANISEQHRAMAKYVDKILKGAKPADLPVEQPKKFDFVVNLKAAKQIGLTIPPNVLARADRVIK